MCACVGEEARIKRERTLHRSEIGRDVYYDKGKIR